MNLLAVFLWLAPPVAPGPSAPAAPWATVPAPSSPEAALRGYEYVPVVVRPDPVTLAAWRRVAADPQEDPVIRGRALSLLSRTGDRAEEPLIRALMSSAEEPFLRRKAVESLAHLRGPAVAGELEALFLGARADVRLRAACARALVSFGAAAAPTRLRLRARETEPEIRRLLAVEAGPGPITPPSLPRRTRP